MHEWVLAQYQTFGEKNPWGDRYLHRRHFDGVLQYMLNIILYCTWYVNSKVIATTGCGLCVIVIVLTSKPLLELL